MGIARKLADFARLLNTGGKAAAGPNLLINGDFDIWQRGDAFAALSANTYAADRWFFNASGGVGTITKFPFTLGHADVPGNPTNFMRLAVTTGNDFTGITQRIEGVRNLAGKKATLTFWAKGTNPAGGVLSTYFIQGFGSGGSSSVEPSPKQTFSLTSNWKKFSFLFDIPSISGKTLGSTPDHLGITINQGADTGTAAWTIDIAHVSLVEGDARDIDDPFVPRAIQQELSLCQRYYTVGRAAYLGVRGIDVDGENYRVQFPVPMRAQPTVTIGLAYGIADVNVASAAAYVVAQDGFGFMVKPTTAANYVRCNRAWTADAEL